MGDALSHDQGSGSADVAGPGHIIRDRTGTGHIENIFLGDGPGDGIADDTAGNLIFRQSADFAEAVGEAVGSGVGVFLNKGFAADPAGVGGVAVLEAEGLGVNALIRRLMDRNIHVGIDAVQGEAIIDTTAVGSQTDPDGIAGNRHRHTGQIAGGIGAQQGIRTVIQIDPIIAALHKGGGGEGQLQILRAFAGVCIADVAVVGIIVGRFRIIRTVLQDFALCALGVDQDLKGSRQIAVSHSHSASARGRGITGNNGHILCAQCRRQALGILRIENDTGQIDRIPRLIQDLIRQCLDLQLHQVRAVEGRVCFFRFLILHSADGLSGFRFRLRCFGGFRGFLHRSLRFFLRFLRRCFRFRLRILRRGLGFLCRLLRRCFGFFFHCRFGRFRDRNFRSNGLRFLCTDRNRRHHAKQHDTNQQCTDRTFEY